jgi:hypothetical protein
MWQYIERAWRWLSFKFIRGEKERKKKKEGYLKCGAILFLSPSLFFGQT